MCTGKNLAILYWSIMSVLAKYKAAKVLKSDAFKLFSGLLTTADDSKIQYNAHVATVFEVFGEEDADKSSR